MYRGTSYESKKSYWQSTLEKMKDKNIKIIIETFDNDGCFFGHFDCKTVTLC